MNRSVVQMTKSAACGQVGGTVEDRGTQPTRLTYKFDPINTGL